MSKADVSTPRLLDSVAGAALAAAALSLAFAVIVRRPDLTRGSAFLFGDEGHNLLVAQTLLAGGALYRDVFFGYGPISAYLYALAARLCGNTPLVYLSLLAAISSLNVGLAYALVRRAARPAVAAMVVGAGFIATTLAPGSLVGGYTNSPYIPLERTLLLLVALGWADPDTRSMKRSLLIGLLLGLWQGVKFGGAVPAGAALVLLDAIDLAAGGYSADRFRLWWRSLAAIAAAFLAIELLWVLLAFAALPGPVARDSVWPLYVADSYKSWVNTPGIRWPTWIGWRSTVTQYLIPISAFLLGAVGLAGWFAAARRTGRPALDRAQQAVAGAVFLPLCFFIIGSLTYFRQVHHFRAAMWALVPAVAWELQRSGVLVKTATMALWAPGLAALVKSAVFTSTAAMSLITVALPSGGSIVVAPPMAERLQFLQRFTERETADAPVLYVPLGSGWHAAYHVPRASRQTYLSLSPAWVRPYEETQFIETLSRTRALIVCDGNEDRASDEARLLLPPAIRRVILDRMRPWMTEAGCRVYRLQ